MIAEWSKTFEAHFFDENKLNLEARLLKSKYAYIFYFPVNVVKSEIQKMNFLTCHFFTPFVRKSAQALTSMLFSKKYRSFIYIFFNIYILHSGRAFPILARPETKDKISI